MSTEKKNTYGQILKSSALIGSSSAIGVGFGIIRNKAITMILGAEGLGLAGDFGSIVDLIRTLAGMGVNTSGVRQIAEAVGSGDEQRVARTVKTLRRVSIISGILGAFIMIALCVPLANFTFSKDKETVIGGILFDTRAQIFAIALLSLAVLFGDISSGQAALVQGMRRLADLAKINVLGALYGTLFSVPIVYIWGPRGVVPSLICVAAMGIVTSWWYARKVKIVPVTLDSNDFKRETGSLLKMGVVFMASGLMTTGVAFLVRVIITNQISLKAAGYYQGAWALGGFYIGYVLQAMGTDFFPRLTAVAKDNDECNRLVNEQTEVGLLLAGPGLILTLTFSGLLLKLFYVKQFGNVQPAVEILRWICLGMILRVASWPMGFILIAKGARRLYFFTELFSSLIYVGFVWAGAQKFGLQGVGMAFFGLYVVYWIGIYAVVRWLTGFRWSGANVRLSMVFVPLVIGVFVVWYLPISQLAVGIIGSAAAVASGIYSLRTLCTLIPLQRFPRMAQNLLLFLRLVPAANDAPAG